MTAAHGLPARVPDGPALVVRDTPVAVTSVSPAPALLATLAVAAVLAALVSGRVQLVALATPLALAAVAGLSRSTAEAVTVGVTVDRLATVEGEQVTVVVEVLADRPIDRLELAVDSVGALAASRVGGALRVRPGRPGTRELVLACEQWGVGTVGELVLRWRDPAGVVVRTARVGVGAVVRVLPSAQRLGTLVRTEETQVAAGNAVAREVGEGVEFGDVRRYAPGDRLHAVNWRVSARRGGLWVTDRHLERNVEVVLAVDAVLPGALPAAVRGATALADAYLAERDRVGLIGIGGALRWLRPGAGTAQRYLIVEELIAAQAFALQTWGSGLSLPSHALPPRALVVALTSLLDDRSAGVLLKLRDAGLAMAVVQIEAPPLPSPAGTRAGDIADRLWRLSAEARRLRLRARGVGVATWREGEPLEATMAEIAMFRRALRRPGG